MYHFNKLIVTDTVGLIRIIKAKQNFGFLLKGALYHNVNGRQELFKSDVSFAAFIKEPEHFITPEAIQVKKGVKVLTYDTRLCGTTCNVLEHEFQQLQLIRRIFL